MPSAFKIAARLRETSLDQAGKAHVSDEASAAKEQGFCRMNALDQLNCRQHDCRQPGPPMLDCRQSETGRRSISERRLPKARATAALLLGLAGNADLHKLARTRVFWDDAARSRFDSWANSAIVRRFTPAKSHKWKPRFAWLD